MLDVFITFDTELWCDGWDRLDAKFPAAFRRYVYGPTARGDYALPATLDILAEHGLTGVFFVEPLFAARFGQAALEEIVGLIRGRAQEVQLHLHSEWADEASPPLLPGVTGKRQYLARCTLAEQERLIGIGRDLLVAAGAQAPTAFRAGNYALNRDTLRALSRLGIPLDSSYNPAAAIDTGLATEGNPLLQPVPLEGVIEYPVSVFHDGRGLRHLQVTACSFDEFRYVLDHAATEGWQGVVIVSHNFELLNPAKTRPDPVVVRRFRRLCSYLARHDERFRVRGFRGLAPRAHAGTATMPRSHLLRTGGRVLEQGARRLLVR
jgi:peptidoglycan/xylan/chitin deacetylase (PgdA/CDA1 family)